MTTDLSGLYAVTPDDRLLPRLSALVEAALAGGTRLCNTPTSWRQRPCGAPRPPNCCASSGPTAPS